MEYATEYKFTITTAIRPYVNCVEDKRRFAQSPCTCIAYVTTIMIDWQVTYELIFSVHGTRGRVR